MRCLRQAVATLMLFLLASCLMNSKEPLFGAGDTPFPVSFRAALVTEGAEGRKVQFGNNKPEVFQFSQKGLSYVADNDDEHFELTVRAWDTSSHMYAMQLVITARGDDKRIIYGLMQIRDTIAVVYLPSSSDTQLISDMREGKVNFTQSSDGLSFDNRASLMNGLGVLNTHLAKSTKITLVVAATPQQLSSLQTAIDTHGIVPNIPTPSGNRDSQSVDVQQAIIGLGVAALIYSFEKSLTPPKTQEEADAREESRLKYLHHVDVCRNAGDLTAQIENCLPWERSRY